VHDELTGLLNRRGFFGRAAAALDEAARAGVPCVLLYGDVDRFKQLNDTYGHAVGDEGLRVVAAALRATSRPGDVAARLGGDEFVALLVGAGASAGDAARARLRRALATTPVLARDGMPPVFVSAAFGAAVQPADGADEPGDTAARAAARLERLLREADQALYAEKRERR
jgi:diguanylate cyclase (GGDEF)-like protein